LSEKKGKLKKTEIRIIAELMKNCRRTDREIAKAVGVSQPTVGRTIKRLEKEGIIKEYAMIPDFHRLGFEIMGFTRFHLHEKPYADRARVREKLIQEFASVAAVEGVGEGANRMLVSLYESYSEYSKVRNILRAVPIIDVDQIDSFLADLNGKKSYRYLSMSAVANHLLQRLKDKSVS
jgi:Lrp/AsnC family leucine-responsive transcriptional regulator